MSNCWLQQHPRYTHPIAINDKEFIICGQRSFLIDNKRIQISKFNIEKNAWSVINIKNTPKYKNTTQSMESINNAPDFYKTTAFDKENQILHLIDTDGKLWSIDIDNKIISNCRTAFHNYQLLDYCYGGKLEMINNKLYSLTKIYKQTNIQNIADDSGMLY